MNSSDFFYHKENIDNFINYSHLESVIIQKRMLQLFVKLHDTESVVI